jgi:7-cyano-7-deazaguanine synthase
MKVDKIAVVLLSGGLDSTTTAAIASKQGYEIYGLTFQYGQRHEFEIEAARKVAEFLGIREHLILNIDPKSLGGSALTGSGEVPRGRSLKEIKAEIPVTYVPARNTIFLAFALALAEVKNTGDIFIGVNAVDYSGYPDCRLEYLRAFQNLATRAAVKGRQKITIHAPLLHLSKADIIRKGMSLGVDYSLTHTCYDPNENGMACGSCDACQLRLNGFREAGFKDPLPYQAELTGQ